MFASEWAHPSLANLQRIKGQGPGIRIKDLVIIIFNNIHELLTSFCMKDNPGAGGALRGGKKGRKAWEIDEDAT